MFGVFRVLRVFSFLFFVVFGFLRFLGFLGFRVHSSVELREEEPIIHSQFGVWAQGFGPRV